MAELIKPLERMTDGELLDRHQAGDESAFAEVVERHGAMVISACRRALGPAEAEDAAQAVFVVLARKAAALRPEKSLAGWLHRTARMVSGTALRERSRRRLHEEEAAAMRRRDAAVESAGAAEHAELLAGLDGAIEALPGRLREVLVLCYLGDLSQSEAARRLEMPLGTVAVYCKRGLERLRGQLVRRVGRPGEVLGAEALGALLLGSATGAATLPAGFLASTLSVAKGAVTAAPPVVALANGVLKAVFWHKVQMAAAAVAAAIAVGTAVPLTVRALAGSGAVSRQAPENQPPTAPADSDRATGPDRPPPPEQPPAQPPPRDRGEDVWEVDCIDSHMEATWAGGTDMLLKTVELILKNPDTDVPVACGGSWDEAIELGKVTGKSRDAMAVDIAGQGVRALFVLSDGGDKVFAYDPKARKFADVTAKLKLGSKSAVAAWGDFNGDGLLDLASSDGKALTLWSQAADGTFASAAVADVPKDECVGLAAVDAGVKGRAGLVWSGKGAAVLLVPDKEKAGVFALKPLTAAAGALKDPAGPGACLVADFDGDAIADIIEPFARGSVFFKGKGGGEFAEGAPCAVALGDGRTGAFLGDFDADGRLDVLTTAEDSPRLWQNSGSGRFENLFHLCGELAYISKPGCIGGNTCDINNDGRQDVFLTYPEMGAQVFFNRSHRSFGHAHKPIDLAETGNLPEALTGQQCGVLADFSGDGAQDMALVLLDGKVVLLPQTLPGDAALAMRVAVAPGASAGPILVSAANDRRALGAWAVAPGVNEAFFGRADAGEVTVTWQLPGGEPRRKTFTLESKPVRFVIGGERR